jgi:hypothetical protein
MGGRSSTLTYGADAPKLVRMVFARTIFAAVLTVAVVGYAFDCSPTANAETAMQCCKSMGCMQHHHRGEDCCKTMPTTRVVVGEPTSAGVSFAPVVFGIVQAHSESPSAIVFARVISDQSHAPPDLFSPTLLSLRI